MDESAPSISSSSSAGVAPPSPTRLRRRRGIVERVLRRCGGVISITMLISWGAYTFWTSTASVLQATLDITTMQMNILTFGLFFTAFMSLWCLTMASWKDPGYFPPHAREKVTFRSAVPSFIQTEESSKNNHQLRYCKHCKCSKPDRSYHVHSVGSCVLRLDHFCPMIGAPVGFRNQKQFCLFLYYVVTLCSAVAIINLHCLTHVFESHDLYDIPQELQDSVWWVDGVVYEYRQPGSDVTERDDISTEVFDKHLVSIDVASKIEQQQHNHEYALTFEDIQDWEQRQSESTNNMVEVDDPSSSSSIPHHSPILIFANKRRLVIEHSTQVSICIATVLVISIWLIPVQFKNAVHNVTQQEDDAFEDELLSPRTADGSVDEVWSKQKYDLGLKRNLMQVFGGEPWQWLLPLTPFHMDLPLAGVEWEVSPKWLNAYELHWGIAK